MYQVPFLHHERIWEHGVISSFWHWELNRKLCFPWHCLFIYLSIYRRPMTIIGQLCYWPFNLFLYLGVKGLGNWWWLELGTRVMTLPTLEVWIGLVFSFLAVFQGLECYSWQGACQTLWFWAGKAQGSNITTPWNEFNLWDKDTLCGLKTLQHAVALWAIMPILVKTHQIWILGLPNSSLWWFS